MPCVEQFLAEDYLRPPGHDVYQDCFDSPWFFPLQRREELRRMVQIARSINPTTVMEIGADKGSGLYHWCKALPTVKRVIACEIRGTPYASAFQSAFKHLQFLWLSGDSQGSFTKKTVCEFMLPSSLIDMLFIDGDKLGFVEDFDAYLPLMNPHGVVFMHDVTDREPQRAFLTIQARGYRTETIIDRTDTDEAMGRAAKGIPPASAHEGWLRHWHGRSCGVGVVYLEK